MSFLTKMAQKRLEEYHSHFKPELLSEIQILESTGRKITQEEYLAFFKKYDGLNSWEREALIPHMDNEALIQNVEYCLSQCQRARNPSATYDEAIIGVYAPEIIKRLKDVK